MDFIDEQHVALFEIGEKRGKIAGLGDHRAGRGAEIDGKLARHDLRQSGLAEAGRADEQHLVERFFPRPRRLDEHGEIFACLLLADESAEPLRPQRGLGQILVAPLGRNQLAFRRRAHRSGPRLYLLGSSSPIGTALGVRPFGTMTRALRS